jgi:ubiquinone/menaquinone biosynthesis C-methylase UbiE
MIMDSKQIGDEFNRQAERMANAPAFHVKTILDWFVTAIAASPPGKVLDLACGPGIVAEVVAPHASELVGVDLSPEMLRLAEQRLAMARLGNCRFIMAPADQLPFEDDTYNTVVTRLSLHHFPVLSSVLAEVRRVLSPHGTLILADILSSEDPGEAELHNALEQLRDPTHVRMLSRSELRRELESAGFEISSETTWEQPRRFEEWAKVVDDPSRTNSLFVVMRSLARQGVSAGIDLREIANDIGFTHTWSMIKARSARSTE